MNKTEQTKEDLIRNLYKEKFDYVLYHLELINNEAPSLFYKDILAYKIIVSEYFEHKKIHRIISEKDSLVCRDYFKNAIRTLIEKVYGYKNDNLNYSINDLNIIKSTIGKAELNRAIKLLMRLFTDSNSYYSNTFYELFGNINTIQNQKFENEYKSSLTSFGALKLLNKLEYELKFSSSNKVYSEILNNDSIAYIKECINSNRIDLSLNALEELIINSYGSSKKQLIKVGQREMTTTQSNQAKKIKNNGELILFLTEKIFKSNHSKEVRPIYYNYVYHNEIIKKFYITKSIYDKLIHESLVIGTRDLVEFFYEVKTIILEIFELIEHSIEYNIIFFEELIPEINNQKKEWDHASMNLAKKHISEANLEKAINLLLSELDGMDDYCNDLILQKSRLNSNKRKQRNGLKYDETLENQISFNLLELIGELFDSSKKKK